MNLGNVELNLNRDEYDRLLDMSPLFKIMYDDDTTESEEQKMKMTTRSVQLPTGITEKRFRELFEISNGGRTSVGQMQEYILLHMLPRCVSHVTTKNRRIVLHMLHEPHQQTRLLDPHQIEWVAYALMDADALNFNDAKEALETLIFENIQKGCRTVEDTTTMLKGRGAQKLLGSFAFQNVLQKALAVDLDKQPSRHNLFSRLKAVVAKWHPKRITNPFWMHQKLARQLENWKALRDQLDHAKYVLTDEDVRSLKRDMRSTNGMLIDFPGIERALAKVVSYVKEITKQPKVIDNMHPLMDGFLAGHLDFTETNINEWKTRNSALDTVNAHRFSEVARVVSDIKQLIPSEEFVRGLVLIGLKMYVRKSSGSVFKQTIRFQIRVLCVFLSFTLSFFCVPLSLCYRLCSLTFADISSSIFVRCFFLSRSQMALNAVKTSWTLFPVTWKHSCGSTSDDSCVVCG